jgi:hypothetical protein
MSEYLKIINGHECTNLIIFNFIKKWLLIYCKQDNIRAFVALCFLFPSK